jgi:hypothetical protein
MRRRTLRRPLREARASLACSTSRASLSARIADGDGVCSATRWLGFLPGNRANTEYFGNTALGIVTGRDDSTAAGSLQNGHARVTPRASEAFSAPAAGLEPATRRLTEEQIPTQSEWLRQDASLGEGTAPDRDSASFTVRQDDSSRNVAGSGVQCTDSCAPRETAACRRCRVRARTRCDSRPSSRWTQGTMSAQLSFSTCWAASDVVEGSRRSKVVIVNSLSRDGFESGSNPQGGSTP